MSHFTERLYIETKDSHTAVDRHPFVSMIRKDRLAGEMYINFNKICIHELQQVLELKDKNLQSRLHRDIDIPDIFITNTLSTLLTHCRKYSLESAYQFYLGLLFGGNMLKRMLPEYHEFLTYHDSKELVSNFKEYLCNNVKNQDQDIFIDNVNESYKLIKTLFDEFYARLNNKLDNKLDIKHTPLDTQETRQLDGGPGTYPDPDTGLF
jgi:hypothetical protein